MGPNACNALRVEKAFLTKVHDSFKAMADAACCDISVEGSQVFAKLSAAGDPSHAEEVNIFH